MSTVSRTGDSSAKWTAKSVAMGAVAIALLMLGSSCGLRDDWIAFRGDGGRGHTSNPMPPPLGIRWKLQLQTDQMRAFAFNNLVIKDNVMYFGSTDGNFYAMDIETGYMRWVFKTGAPVNSIPYADDRNVYFGSNDGHAYAVSQEDGSELWRYQTGRTVQSTVLRHDDYVIFSSDGGGTHFVNLDGELVHEIANPIWHRDSFQIFDNVMYFARGPISNPRTLGAYDLQTRDYHWLLPAEVMDATWYSFPAVTERRVFMATSRSRGDYWEYRHYALNRRSGEIEWVHYAESRWGVDRPSNPFMEFRGNLNILDFQAPAVWRNHVIVTGGDNVVRALDARSGTKVWQREFSRRTSSAPTIAGDRVYVGLRGEDVSAEPQNQPLPGLGAWSVSVEHDFEPRPPRLVALSARNGRVIWELEIEGSILSPPVIAGRWVVFGTDRNFVYVLERVVG
ncbi:MAG: hypothetical protein EA384_07680 [Spirochaetaceae bacterium]|nr:MAG: hypothetical protein EA384_07680 [Spirochaetaceae bacterium]